MKIEGFAGGSYRSQSINADCEISRNVFPEFMESAGAKTDRVLYDCPGFTPEFALTPGPIRGGFSQNGRDFLVSGFNFYETTNGFVTLRGTVAVDSNPATLTSNGDGGKQVGITSGDHFYCFDLQTNVLTDVLMSGATMCDFLDGYVIVLDTGNSLIKVSDLDDCSNFDPLQFAQNSLSADKWVAMKVVHSDINLIGSQSGQAWYAAGTFPFPFAPRPGQLWQQGTSAPFSLQAVNDTLLYVSQNSQGGAMLQRLVNYGAVRTSTHAVEFAWQQYPSLSDAVAMSYQQNGHAFYVVNFGAANASWGYDAATNEWHQRGYWNTSTGAYDAYRAQTIVATGNNRILAGDRLTGNVFTLSTETSLEVDGTGIRRQRRFRAMSDNEKYLFYSNLQIDMQVGVGLTTGQGSDPQLQISWSKDGGYSFSGVCWASMGKVGAYTTRVMKRGIVGRARNMVFDLVCSEPVPCRWLQAFVDVEEGTW